MTDSFSNEISLEEIINGVDPLEDGYGFIDEDDYEVKQQSMFDGFDTDFLELE